MERRTRTNEVRIRMNDDEFQTYKNRLEESKMTAQKYGLRCLLDSDKIKVTENASQIFRHLAAIGNNLNQLARANNSDQIIPPETVEIVKKESEILWRLLKPGNPEKV